MKLENKNENYAATVVCVKSLVPLNGLDNLVGLPVFGYMALVPKTTQVGSLMVVFTAETQLSDGFARNNNLYRHNNLNADETASGYLEDNRRVKALKLRGHVSSALAMPIESLYAVDAEAPPALQEGDTFTHINEIEVCRKYQNPKRVSLKGVPNNREQRIEDKLFPRHFDTHNWFKSGHIIEDGETVIITQKLHGTSARFTNQIVSRKLSWIEKVAKWFGAKVVETEYASIAGTRKTIRDPKTEGPFDHDVWTIWNERISSAIPKNWVVYGEICGYAGDKEIQPNFTYQESRGDSSFYVYRIAIVNEDGVSVDLGWDAVRQWCLHNGFEHVPEVHRCSKDNAQDIIDQMLDSRFSELPIKTRDAMIPLDKQSVCDEGLCIRAERQTPIILKAKSPLFLAYETKMIDEEKTGLEEEANEAGVESEEVAA
jgi:hypothetical protein